VGAGTCYLKSGTSYNVNSAGNTNVGGLRLAAAPAAASGVTTTTTTTSTTRTSTSSSSTYSPSQAAFACPDYDGEYRAWPDRQDRGYTYACGAVVYPSTSFAQQPALNNWNDCIVQCNNLAGCTGFWYAGGTNGQGPGTCYFINFNNGGFVLSNNTNVAGRLGTSFDTYRITTTTTATTTTTTTSSSSPSSIQTLTFTTVSYATVTTTSSYPITTTAVSTQVQTVTSSYPVTQTQVSTAPGTCESLTIAFKRGVVKSKRSTDY